MEDVSTKTGWSADRIAASAARPKDAGLGSAHLMEDISTKTGWSADHPVFVEIPGFEPGQTEPKSVVLPLHHISIPRCKDIIIFEYLQVLKKTVDQVPDEETGEFADKEENHGPAGAGLVESEGYGDDISDEGNPCGKG